ncbi:MAG: T9SS type A sorting domain-containing protein [Bacteroidia bacterium]|nr:T9SS type A sorting domain-containing protein [Bacteroidia bacterium]
MKPLKLLTILLLLSSNLVVAQKWTPGQKIVQDSRTEDAHFAGAIDIWKNQLIIGSFQSDRNPERVDIFEQDSFGVWNSSTSLELTQSGRRREFGRAVTIYGDYAVVGTPRDGSGLQDSGSCYVYHKTGAHNWELIQKLVPENPRPSAQFGSQVNLTDSFLMVSSPDENNSAGAVYLFRLDKSLGTFTQIQRLTNPFNSITARFGLEIESNPNHLVVSTRNDSVYLYQRNDQGDFEFDSVLASPTSDYEFFGYDLALENDVLAIAAPYQSYGSPPWRPDSLFRAGIVYLYKYDEGSWVPVKELVPPTKRYLGYFGSDIHLRDKRLVIGTGQDTGVVYVSDRKNGQWVISDSIIQDHRIDWDGFGLRVAHNGSTLVVGAPYHSHDSANKNFVENAGAVYTFNLSCEYVQFNNGLTESNGTLISADENALYRWFDCEDNVGSTLGNKQSFEPLKSGTYAVELSKGQCRDTSACHYVTSNALISPIKISEPMVFPNPCDTYLQLTPTHDYTLAEVIGADGRTLVTQPLIDQSTVSTKSLLPGVYFLIVTSKQNTKRVIRFVRL